MKLKNLIMDRWQSDQPIINGWVSYGSSFIAELMSKQCYHSITIDLQHGLQDFEQMLDTFHGLDLSRVTPLARIPWNSPEWIMKSLDAGALGIICPMINDVEDVVKFINHCYYPPKGERSFGPIRAGQIYEAYPANANEHILPIAMIETRSAVKHLDEILSVPGLKGIYIGPADLSLAHGFSPGVDRQEKEMLALITSIQKKAHQKNLLTGIHTDQASYAIDMIEKGFNLVTVASDIKALTYGLTTILKPLEKLDL